MSFSDRDEYTLFCEEIIMINEKRKEAWRSRLTPQQIFSIPNILSFFRIALIPLILWLYLVKDSPELTIAAIILSSITDIVDGFIARRFNMITDFGKALDPVADKLTQCSILICLLTRFPLMWIPLILMIVKEIASFILRLIVFNRTEAVHGSRWHGKLATVVIYVVVGLHIIWYNIPPVLSTLTIVAVTAIMLTSFILYTVASVKFLIKKTS